MIERGIVVRGRVIRGSERVLRDSSAWWTAGRETRPRRWPIDLLVGHWTAGNPRTGPTAGPAVWRAMEARTGVGGRDLSVSVHFVISWDGLIWQTLDLEHAAVHVGHRPTIARSIGVETCWPGTVAQARRLGLDVWLSETRRVGSHRVQCVRPGDALVESWRWLGEVLAGEAAREHGIEIPRIAAPVDRRLTSTELASHRGACEHVHIPGSTKIDAAGYLVESLGWASS